MGASDTLNDGVSWQAAEIEERTAINASKLSCSTMVDNSRPVLAESGVAPLQVEVMQHSMSMPSDVASDTSVNKMDVDSSRAKPIKEEPSSDQDETIVAMPFIAYSSTEESTLKELRRKRNLLIIKEATSGLTHSEARRLTRFEYKLRQLENENEYEEELADEEKSDIGSEGGSSFALSDGEESRDEQPVRQTTPEAIVAADARPKKQSPPKNAREWMERHRQDIEEQNRKQQEAIINKRKREEQHPEPQKRPKTSEDTKSRKYTAADVRASDTVDALASLQAGHGSHINNVPAMAPMKAGTKKDRFAKLKESIPEDCDTRRASTQKKDLQEAWGIFGNRKVKAVDDGWLLKGMLSPLMNHQLCEAAWMVKRECGWDHPYGGVLATAMGMGKTVTSLACIVGNPPSADDGKKFCKATLVIAVNAPAALQWQREVEKHCNERIARTATLYERRHGLKPRRCKKDWIVIATYSDLLSAFPSNKIMDALDNQQYDDREYEKQFTMKAGDLFRINWYRVILDEGQMIKNRATRTARSCWHLKAKYRWVLTGTPLSNSPEEFYPYLKFIRFPVTHEFDDFQGSYIKDVGSSRVIPYAGCVPCLQMATLDGLQAQLRSYGLSSHVSKEEKLIYQALDRFFDPTPPEIEGEDDAAEPGPDSIKASSRGYKNRPLRMRQAVSHIYNLEKLIQESMLAEELETLSRGLMALHRIPFTTQLRKGENDNNNVGRYSVGFDLLAKSPHPVLQGVFDMDTLLAMVRDDHDLKNVSCPACELMPVLKPVRGANCPHIYCERCIHRLIKKGIKCEAPDCGAELAVGSEFKSLKCLQELVPKNGKAKEPGRDSNNVRLSGDAGCNDFFLASYYLDAVQLLPSSKLTVTLAVIKTWQTEAPDDKIIVFTQFVPTAKVLGCMLDLADINFLYYFGESSAKQKNKALREFNENPDIQVLVISLHCGGTSLNLQVANRVIIIDAWWNAAAEEQGFGRVFRCGQTKPTQLVRLWAEDTMDDHIRELQKVKSEAIDYALQDDGHTPSRPSDSQLRKLFGSTAKAVDKKTVGKKTVAEKPAMKKRVAKAQVKAKPVDNTHVETPTVTKKVEE